MNRKAVLYSEILELVGVGSVTSYDCHVGPTPTLGPCTGNAAY